MFPIMDYTLQELSELVKNAKEISQKDNVNANAKLFILEKNVVFKMYIPQSEEYLRNVKNLLLLKKSFELKEIKEIVLPIELVRLNNKIIGYLMPYVKGQTLETFLYDSLVDQKNKVEVFRKLARVVSILPNCIYIGDLHMRNVIVSSNFEIHLIDIDGFSVEDGELLTVPTPLPHISGKYYNNAEVPIISKNSDIFCVYHMYMQWIGQGIDILESDYREQYFSFLSDNNQCDLLLENLKVLYTCRENIITPKVFESPPIDHISWENFLKKFLIQEQNENAIHVIESFWREKE